MRSGGENGAANKHANTRKERRGSHYIGVSACDGVSNFTAIIYTSCIFPLLFFSPSFLYLALLLDPPQESER